ncbi:hypothetical protein [Burkholderia territorii]|uniref:hypothetical protein n=1 Tax=Burkholderia territorii TaxID=1503055 RepID=UPI000AD6C1C6|nr:hypothetical protein [Burkholderia territorii]
MLFTLSTRLHRGVLRHADVHFCAPFIKGAVHDWPRPAALDTEHLSTQAAQRCVRASFQTDIKVGRLPVTMFKERINSTPTNRPQRFALRRYFMAKGRIRIEREWVFDCAVGPVQVPGARHA